jgi:hypothetical protein
MSFPAAECRAGAARATPLHQRLRPRPAIKGEERQRPLNGGRCRRLKKEARAGVALRRRPLIGHAENRIGQPTLEIRVVAELLEQLRVVLEEAYDDTLQGGVMLNAGVLPI